MNWRKVLVAGGSPANFRAVPVKWSGSFGRADCGAGERAAGSGETVDGGRLIQSNTATSSTVNMTRAPLILITTTNVVRLPQGVKCFNYLFGLTPDLLLAAGKDGLEVRRLVFAGDDADLNLLEAGGFEPVVQIALGKARP